MPDNAELANDDGGIPDPRLPDIALGLALSEFLAWAVEGQDLPPGLNMRDAGNDLLEVLSRGRVIATISRSALLERAGVITGQRN